MRFGYCAICVWLHRMRLVRTRLVIVPLRLAASRMRSVRMHFWLCRMRSVAAPCRVGFAVYIVVCRTGGKKGGTLVLSAVVQVYQTCTKRYSSTYRPPLGLTLPAKTSSRHYIAVLALRSRMYVSAFALVVY